MGLLEFLGSHFFFRALTFLGQRALVGLGSKGLVGLQGLRVHAAVGSLSSGWWGWGLAGVLQGSAAAGRCGFNDALAQVPTMFGNIGNYQYFKVCRTCH